MKNNIFSMLYFVAITSLAGCQDKENVTADTSSGEAKDKEAITEKSELANGEKLEVAILGLTRKLANGEISLKEYFNNIDTRGTGTKEDYLIRFASSNAVGYAPNRSADSHLYVEADTILAKRILSQYPKVRGFCKKQEGILMLDLTKLSNNWRFIPSLKNE